MMIALCLVEISVIFLLLPFRFAIKIHARLNEGKAVVEIKLFGVSVLRLKCVSSGGFKLYINGKSKQYSKGDMTPSKVIELVRMLKNDISYPSMLAVVGGDMKNCAMACTILNILPNVNSNAYLGTSRDKFDVDMRCELSLNVIEIASLIVLSKQRSVYAKF